ncbi:MAG: uracil-DNA glycosylase family protein [Candidatus Paceibacterota bacterium]
MQLKHLHKRFDRLQVLHGHSNLNSVYGAGCIRSPQIMLIFMNPTARNISADKNWKGLRAPWLGTKNIWKLLYKLEFISKSSFDKTQKIKFGDWTYDFSKNIYQEINENKVYITNLAKCTQIDAHSLNDRIFREYLDLMFREILSVNPKKIITFGNQVSSILLDKKIKVSNYKNKEGETLNVRNKKFLVYPTYYPVGQGMRNMNLAVERINKVLRY